MFITKMSLPRRAFLRGIGVTLALPWLDAMVPAFSGGARAAAGQPPRAECRADQRRHRFRVSRGSEQYHSTKF